jgi:hypothetical protein
MNDIKTIAKTIVQSVLWEKIFLDFLDLQIRGLWVYVGWNLVMPKLNWPTLKYIECMGLLLLIGQVCTYICITVKIKEMPEKKS